jgi:hypothetical protein
VTNEVTKDLWGPTAHRKREVPGIRGGMHGKYPSHFPMRQIKQEKSSTVLVTQIWLNDMYCPGPPWERSLRSGQVVVIFSFASSAILNPNPHLLQNKEKKSSIAVLRSFSFLSVSKVQMLCSGLHQHFGCHVQHKETDMMKFCNLYILKYVVKF